MVSTVDDVEVGHEAIYGRHDEGKLLGCGFQWRYEVL